MRSPKSARPRPQLEELEPRLTPAPITAITSVAAGPVGGEQVQVAFQVTNPDQATGYKYQVDWGDGNVTTVDPTPGNDTSLASIGPASPGHTYQNAGIYHIQVTAASPSDNVFGPAATSGDIVTGTTGDDTIALTGTTAFFGTVRGVNVNVNGQDLGFAQPIRNVPNGPQITTPILVLAGQGDDQITLDNWEPFLTYLHTTASGPDTAQLPPLVMDGQGGSDTYTVNYRTTSDSWSLKTFFSSKVAINDSGLTADTDRLIVNGSSDPLTSDSYYVGKYYDPALPPNPNDTPPPSPSSTPTSTYPVP
jgi:hypothetical protein